METLKILIGRSSQCDFVVDNTEQNGGVSGRHATLSETDNPNMFIYEDHSTNGSYINGKFIHKESCKVSVTDHILLGKTYTLPMVEIAKRYFSSQRTTEKKNIEPPINLNSLGRETELKPVKQINETPVNPNVNSKPKSDFSAEFYVSGWVWVVVLIAFGLGFLIGGLCI